MLGYETNAGRQPDLGGARCGIRQSREGIGDRSICRRRELAGRIRILGRVFVEQDDIAQIVEKPNRSAVVATVLTHSGATDGPMPTAKYPTCMISLQ